MGVEYMAKITLFAVITPINRDELKVCSAKNMYFPSLVPDAQSE